MHLGSGRGGVLGAAACGSNREVNTRSGAQEGAGETQSYAQIHQIRAGDGLPGASRACRNAQKCTASERANTALREPKTMSELLMGRLIRWAKVQHPY